MQKTFIYTSGAILLFKHLVFPGISAVFQFVIPLYLI